MTKKLLIFFLITIPFLLRAQGGADYLKILKKAGDYNNHDNRKIPAFTYQSAADTQLVALRKKYNLDSIAGYSNEESRVLNLMHWVHNTINHIGVSNGGIKELNADAIITTTRANKIGVSRKELATVLNDLYLAMGFKSRKIYCLPRDSAENDADFHVINIVYLTSQKKWIWVDPTNDAYIMNRDGELLNIEEVRKLLVNNKTVIVNPEANLNRHESVTENEYLAYMEKNLYLFYCPLNSEYDYETKSANKTVTYIYLLPLDYGKTYAFKSETNDKSLGLTNIIYRTNNPSLFWQEPTEKESFKNSK
ncbi:MAG: transglutaminase protein [Mucilaginibacter sp.]|nr:transglutaminase protein [Mucilaginibacter sp.]